MKFPAAVALSVILTMGAACDAVQAPAVIPTLMQLPTDTPTATASPPAPTADAATELPQPSAIDATATDGAVRATWTPTETATALPLPTETPTVTPSLTITPTPTYTPSATFTPSATPTASPEPRALSGLIELALRATILPATVVAPPVMQSPLIQPPPQLIAPGIMPSPVRAACPVAPGGSFGALYQGDGTVANLLGCPVGGKYTLVTAVQMFERGGMLYISGQPGAIYALFSDGRFQRFDDTFVEGVDPERGAESPPVGLVAPVRGFLKVWQSSPTVRAALGWGVTEEAGNESRLLNFERGRMIYLPQRNQTVVLVDDPGGASGNWRMLQGGA